MASVENFAEQERLRTLRSYNLLDTEPQREYDELVAVAADYLNAPLAFFSLVDGQGVWFKASLGTDVNELRRSSSFCGEVADTNSLLVVEDAKKDSRFAGSDLVQAEQPVRFYIGVPIRAKNGHVLGTLCVLDLTPRTVSDQEVKILETLARAMEWQLELASMVVSQKKLFEERAILTNMIVHDAGGIVSALRWNFERLANSVGDDVGTLADCQTAADELLRLCESVLNTTDDQPRSLTVDWETRELKPWFDSLGERLKRMAADNGMDFNIDNCLLEQPVRMDTHLLERMLMNLFRNAIQAGSAGGKITLSGTVDENLALVFTVADDGPGVPAELLDKLFEPYVSSRLSSPRGAGLGLAICRLGARALGGSISFRPRDPGAEFEIIVPPAVDAERAERLRIN
jgi:signal transduction histidine kinase